MLDSVSMLDCQVSPGCYRHDSKRYNLWLSFPLPPTRGLLVERVWLGVDPKTRQLCVPCMQVGDSPGGQSLITQPKSCVPCLQVGDSLGRQSLITQPTFNKYNCHMAIAFVQSLTHVAWKMDYKRWWWWWWWWWWWFRSVLIKIKCTPYPPPSKNDQPVT